MLLDTISLPGSFFVKEKPEVLSEVQAVLEAFIGQQGDLSDNLGGTLSSILFQTVSQDHKQRAYHGELSIQNPQMIGSVFFDKALSPRVSLPL